MYSRLVPSEHRLETPIPIVFGITDLDVGGAEKALVQLVTRLDRSRWSPSVVGLQPEGPLAETLRKASIDVLSLNVRSWRNAAKAFRRWRCELITRQPAVLQTYLFHANLLGRIAGRAAGVPVIASGVRVAERRTKGHLLVDQLTHRLADAHVCVSRAVADYHAAAARIPGTRVVVIPNAVEAPHTNPPSADWSSLNLPPAGAKLVFIGRLEPQKGLDLLFDAIAGLPTEKRPSLVVLGAGPDRQRLETQAEGLGIANLVRFLGWRPNPTEWIAAADALVLPSRWEGMPNVVLEAMAVGKPAIATNVEGVTDLIDDGRTGWIAEPENPESLSRTLFRFLDDRNQWFAIGAAARQKAETEFAVEAIVERYERLWLGLLKRHRRKVRPVSHFIVPNYRH